MWVFNLTSWLPWPLRVSSFLQTCDILVTSRNRYKLASAHYTALHGFTILLANMAPSMNQLQTTIIIKLDLIEHMGTLPSTKTPSITTRLRVTYKLGLQTHLGFFLPLHPSKHALSTISLLLFRSTVLPLHFSLLEHLLSWCLHPLLEAL
eukprot:Gb_34710 [translate_table: standard]